MDIRQQIDALTADAGRITERIRHRIDELRALESRFPAKRGRPRKLPEDLRLTIRDMSPKGRA